MRILLLLMLVAVAAFYTKPDRAAHEAKARTVLEAPNVREERGLDVGDVIGFVRGLTAGTGRYEDMYLFSKYTLDAPGATYVECYGAFTYVHCQLR